MTDTLKLSQIQRDGSCQSRASVFPAIIQEYANAMIQGAEFPPVVVFHDKDGKYWLADGHYRCAARELYAAEKGWTDCQIEVKIKNGTHRDARLYAVGCNRGHGVQRSNADKRHAVKMLLADPEWAKASTSWLAQAAGVSETLVDEVRASLRPRTSRSEARRGRDGKVRRLPKPRQARGVRQPGDDTEAIKDEKRRARRIGKEVFDWRAYNAAFKTILQQIDGLARHLGLVNGQGAITGDLGYRGLDRKIKELDYETKQWFKQHTKMEPPE